MRFKPLLRGSSVAALTVAAVALASGAIAANVVFNTPQTSIDINYDVNGSVELNSTVGPTDIGVEVFGAPVISGDIINSGTISASRTGLVVDADNLAGSVINNGSVVVTGTEMQFGTTSAQSFWDAAGINVNASATAPGDNISLDLENSGSVEVSASASASASTNYAYAFADATGIDQLGYAYGGASTVNLVNSGVVDVSATATATIGGDGNGGAEASATGIYQYAGGELDAAATISNSGTVVAAAETDLDVGGTLTGNGYSYAAATGIDQYAYSEFGDAAATIDNSGSVTATASADLSFDQSGGFVYSYAQADVTGIYQEAEAYAGDAQVALTNSGDVSAIATIDVLATGSGAYNYAGDPNYNSSSAQSSSNAYGAAGVYQYAAGTSAGTAFTNSGSVVASITSTQQLDNNYGYADVRSVGLYQYAGGGPSAEAQTINSGAILSTASTTLSGAAAYGYAIAAGIEQEAYGTSASMQVQNTGFIGAAAQSNAIGHSGDSYGYAAAVGIKQSSTVPEASFGVDNSGTILVAAIGSAVGNYAYANAAAVGVDIDIGSGSAILDVENSGSIAAIAAASASGTFSSSAIASAYGLTIYGGQLAGAIGNSGTIDVEAYGFSGDATAVGVSIVADANGSTFTNTGIIEAYAEESGTAYATGLYVGAANDGFFTQSPGTILNNGGTVLATFSADGGVTTSLGNAINAQNAVANQVISLQGETRDGYLLGNILLNATGEIQVTNGETVFDGIVNPFGMNGSMSIFDDGIFRVGNHADYGPSYVTVNQFTVAEDGTIAFALNSNSAIHGQVFAGGANFDGTIKGHFQADYYTAAAYTYNDVINVTGAFAGDFDFATSNTPLMTVTHTLDGNTVDLMATRNSFGSVGGLNGNQQALADYIDSLYDNAGGTPYEDLFGAFFALEGLDGYKGGLDQLTGAEIAQGLAGQLNSFGALNGVVFQRLGGGGTGEPLAYAAEPQAAAAAAIDDVVPDPLDTSTMAWAKGVGAFASFDGDADHTGYDSVAGALYVGADRMFAADLTLGLAGGLLTDGTGFDNGARFDFSGLQAAAYGRWDDGAHYVRGSLGVGAFGNESERQVDLGGTLETATASFASAAVSAQVEVGADLVEAGGVLIGTFAALGYTHGWHAGFTETGLSAGNLDVAAGGDNSLVAGLGFSLEGEHVVGERLVTTSARLGYEHEFLGGYGLSASFVGAPGAGNFNVVGDDGLANFVTLGLGAQVELAPETHVTLDYSGRFSTGYMENSGTVTYQKKF